MSFATRLLTAGTAAAFMAVNAAGAQITFTGFTNGCFYAVGSSVCTPENTNTAATDASGPLTYRNSTFSVTTVGNTAAIGNVSSTPNVDNLGSIALPAGPVNFTDFVNQRFVINVVFTSPTGVNLTNNTWTATLAGTVNQTAGGVSLDFDNTPRVFTYNGGTFTLKLDDVSLTKNSLATQVAVTGFITASATTTVPEPSTWALMASGLVGVVVMRRRRTT